MRDLLRSQIRSEEVICFEGELPGCYDSCCLGEKEIFIPRFSDRRIAMNLDLTGEQRRWRDLARDFARSTIKPCAERLDREQKFPYDIIAEMARLGLMGLTLPK